jgi:hypothetical protein
VSPLIYFSFKLQPTPLYLDLQERVDVFAVIYYA